MWPLAWPAEENVPILEGWKASAPETMIVAQQPDDSLQNNNFELCDAMDNFKFQKQRPENPR